MQERHALLSRSWKMDETKVMLGERAHSVYCCCYCWQKLKKEASHHLISTGWSFRLTYTYLSNHVHVRHLCTGTFSLSCFIWLWASIMSSSFLCVKQRMKRTLLLCPNTLKQTSWKWPDDPTSSSRPCAHCSAWWSPMAIKYQRKGIA